MKIHSTQLAIPTAIIGLASLLSACGSDDPAVMPDVTTRRLDIAISDIERAGFEDEVEVLGGGTFGVVDESNWTVCDQEPAAGDEIGAAPRLTVDRSCGEQDTLEGEGTPEVEPEPESESESAQREKKKATGNRKGNAGGSGADDTFMMPNLMGMVLQDAQDELQARGSFLLTQTDATGMERFQVDDSNWKVCGQVPAPGTRVSLARLVELHAVQLDEQCP